MRKVIASIKSAIHPLYVEDRVVGTCFTSTTGYVITCVHVLENQAMPTALIKDTKIKLIPVIQDKSSDIAICKLEGDEHKYNLGLELGSYDDAEEGDDALMCGFPLGLDYHVAHRGMISAKGIINGRQSFQIDASINRGNSGGPCIVLKNGKPIVIGVIATRLVDVDFTVLKELTTSLQEEGKRLREGTTGQVVAAAIARILLQLTNDVGHTLAQFNRYLNVGFGEAISIDYAVSAIKRLK